MNGGSNLSHGQRGRDTVLHVPQGTVVRALDDADDDDWLDLFDDDDDDDSAGERRPASPPRRREIDLIDDGAETVVARGGRGGVGNRSSNMRYRKGVQYVPESGASGTRVRLELELKIIADIGLVGFPNAGKSTLLSAICAARPKIAAYPFTTLSPNLGVVEFGDVARSRCTVADIPGLIAGAADNRGLGHRFLRHVERTKLVLYVLDVAGTEARDPLDDYRQLRGELARYDPGLVHRPALIFANKTDRRPAACARHLRRLEAEAAGVPIVTGSAATRRNVDGLLRALYALLPRTNPW